MTERICSCCKISKPFTNEFYYLDGNHKAKCRKCKKITIGDKPIKEFMDNLTDNWKNHPDFDFIYYDKFSNQIFNKKTGKYLKNIRSFTNLTKRNIKDIKWETFNGPIPENKIVRTKKEIDTSSTILEDLECVYIHCQKCNILIENPDLLSRYCSKRCQLDNKNIKAGQGRSDDIKKYLASKHHVQKHLNKEKGYSIDYDIDYLLFLGNKCSYCNVECTFGNKEDVSDALTIDRKDSTYPYLKDNIVVCCWFCNIMKNVTIYEDWMQFINFIKDPQINCLDLSEKCFSINSIKIDVSTVYCSLKSKSPEYYPDSSSGKQVFINLCKQQNYKDSIFNFFPIIYLERNCLWNASVDAIDSTLPVCDKHKPDNLQIIPKFMNYGKHVHSQEQFLKEWTKRNFKTDFSNCTVILPDNYHKECYFNKIITK
jgi:hypothetical protein